MAKSFSCEDCSGTTPEFLEPAKHKSEFRAHRGRLSSCPILRRKRILAILSSEPRTSDDANADLRILSAHTEAFFQISPPQNMRKFVRLGADSSATIVATFCLQSARTFEQYSKHLNTIFVLHWFLRFPLFHSTFYFESSMIYCGCFKNQTETLCCKR